MVLLTVAQQNNLVEVKIVAELGIARFNLGTYRMSWPGIGFSQQELNSVAIEYTTDLPLELLRYANCFA